MLPAILHVLDALLHLGDALGVLGVDEESKRACVLHDAVMLVANDIDDE